MKLSFIRQLSIYGPYLLVFFVVNFALEAAPKKTSSKTVDKSSNQNLSDILDNNLNDNSQNFNTNLENNTNDSRKKSTEKLSVDIDSPASKDELDKEEYLQPVTMDFKGASLREVVNVLSEETHINFLVSDKLSEQKIYVNMRNVPWDEALKAILEANGLGLIKMKGNIVRIDTLEALDKEKVDSDTLRKKAALVTPTKVMVVRLSYAKAANIVKLVTNLLPSAAFDKRVKVESDDRTNSIIVEAIPQELSKIKTLIEHLDLETPQVRIESRVVEIVKSNSNLLGINWQAPLNYDQGRGLGFGNLIFPNNLISAFSVDTGAATSSPNTGKFDVHLGSINNITALDLRLRLGELTNQTRSLQNNNVLVVDGEKANIQAGSEDYFLVPTGQGQTSMTSVSYVLSMEVTPHITSDGGVQLIVKVENSAPTTPNGSAVTGKSLRTLTTSMSRRSGETAVIGGLYTTTLSDSKQGIPFLMDFPILGLFFRNHTKTEAKRELIILVTPTIVSGNERVAFEMNNKGLDENNTGNQNNNQNPNNSQGNLNGNSKNSEPRDEVLNDTTQEVKSFDYFNNKTDDKAQKGSEKKESEKKLEGIDANQTIPKKEEI